MFPLSTSQEIVWLHEQMLPGSRAYNFTATLDLRGDLDEDALRAGLAAVLDRHPGLRLELVETSGGLPGQRIRESCPPRLRTVDLSAEDDPEAAFARLLRTEAETPLDVHEAPLLRWTLARLADGHHRLVHVEHHLVHDGHSFAILLRDLFTVYRAHLTGEPVDLPEAPSYAEHIAAASGPGREERRAAGLAHWRGELDGATFDLPLPGLTRPGARRRHAGAQLRQTVEPELAERLREHSRSQGHTPFSTLLALFAELLRRYAGRTDLVVGTAVGNRPAGFEETVGMFVNTIPLRLRLDPEAGADALVDDVTDGLIRALPHQDMPVQVLTRELGLHTSGADNPLFDVMFSAHDAVLPETEVPGLDVSLFEGFNTGTTRFDLDLVLIPDDRRMVGPRSGAGGMTLVWDYDRDLFDEETARLLADRFLRLVRAYLDAPSAPAAALDPEPAPEAAAVPANDAEDVLDPLARHGAGRVALLSGARKLTYGELHSMADELAGRLTAAGVRRGQPVAAVLPRGVHSVVTLLACLRTGTVYCPLSPNDPADRLETLLRRLRPALVLTDRESALSLPAEGLPLALLDGPDFPAAEPAEPLADAAYVIHTSGSTGLPKAVVVGRAALAHHARVTAERYALSPEDRVLVFAQPSFDVALEEVLPSLLAGSCLVLPQREVPTAAELVAVLASRRVTVANLPTSYLLATRAKLTEALRDGMWAPRLLVAGGERLPAAALREVLDATDATVLNAYGVTEATITSTVHEVVREGFDEAAEVPLGAALPGVGVHVLGAGLRPLPAGAVGQLAVSGACLAEGYLGNKEATESRFVRVPALGGERVYLTGDLGFLGRDGLVRFLGRHDNQIKLRGYRIELEEIEAAASAELGGRSCAVVLGRSAAGPCLVGFLDGGAEPDQVALHRALSGRLPAALVPSRWIRLESMPLLSGGKPDRTALARIAETAEETAPEQPETAADPAVELLAEGWREVLGHDRFTPSSHFFQVGGHSLLAAQLAAWLEPRLGGRPPLRVLFQNPVLSEQAHAVAEAVR
ncbi:MULTISPECIES: non-ribosomal peptide synthetase [Streptomyces]|uniref:non-ribosomal peptide synthetase n=1 Tax=Streptomyces TaxID=1883 RepID=UPI00163C38D0|nr:MULTISPECIES: non-ribosomal peptide synthetase [Streptomyces]MBC2878716.1 amino acid adenylation domain-containing protein [Streptomyces sp. TYQ1024]UBI35159.1 amino acid adenylation domain-containing protein [Streptomyces mobaraensis]UKW27752.1 non-ribosomal peptide synthetase [Streptomyces sp. TYQ1024]